MRHYWVIDQAEYHIVKMKQPELQMDQDKQAERRGRKLGEELMAKWNNQGAGI